MSIPREAIDQRVITIYLDSDMNIVKEIEEYNEIMHDCRIKKLTMEEARYAYNIVNPLVAVGMMIGASESVFGHLIPALIILAVNALVYIIFGLIKKKYGICAAVSVSLMLLDLRFIILVVLNGVLWKVYTTIYDTLRRQEGYPLFGDIKIQYERRNEPTEDNYEDNSRFRRLNNL